MAGQPIETIDDLVLAIKSGQISVQDLPVDYIVHDGQTVMLNTRTSRALTQAGIPRNQWLAVDRTGFATYEGMLSRQLGSNRLGLTGTPQTRLSGGGSLGTPSIPTNSYLITPAPFLPFVFPQYDEESDNSED